MPEENKIKKDDAQVDLDTSGPEYDVTLPEEKKEEVVEKEETVKEVIKDQEPEKEVKEEPKEEPRKNPNKKPKKRILNLRITVRVCNLELPNLRVRCGKRKDKETLQPNTLKR